MRIMEFVPLSRSPSRAPPTPVALLIGPTGYRAFEAMKPRQTEITNSSQSQTERQAAA
jgi:hypothetical protein